MRPTKNDTAAPAAKTAPPEEPAEAGAPAAAAPPSRGFAAWIPALVALLAAPAVTWATVEFVLVPRLQKKIANPGSASAAEAHPRTEEKGKDGKGKEAPAGYEFQNVVVNLAGTAGTRYLKTSFLVTGSDAKLRATFEAEKAKLFDVTLNVLAALTLADLEEPGARNVIREKLVISYNQVLGRKVADQVYFSDFVIQ